MALQSVAAHLERATIDDVVLAGGADTRVQLLRQHHVALFQSAASRPTVAVPPAVCTVHR